MRVPRSLLRTRLWGLALVLIVLVSGTALANLVFTPGGLVAPNVSPGPGPFVNRVFINTNLPPAVVPGIGGFGDRIMGVELGRDDRSPFAAIVVWPGVNSPHQGGPHPCHPDSPNQLLLPTVPPIDADLGGGAPPMPGGADYTYVGLSTTFFPVWRFIYRPNMDPMSPGFPGGPTPAGHVEAQVRACESFVNQVRNYVRDVRLGRFLPTQVPSIILEIDGAPPTGPQPTTFEFYKFKIPTSP